MLELWTIGHSTRSLDDLVVLLSRNQIRLLVDVRTVPRSRHVPQFNSDELERSLPQHGIEYLHMKQLGGLRKTVKDSVNLGWKNESFRGYADYMGTPSFREALYELAALARQQRTAIMCAEAVPWRCHRGLIGDAFTLLLGGRVYDIIGPGQPKLHEPTSFARIDDVVIIYPPQDELPLQ